ncbi:uncharacterized protein LOC135835309 isoform X1 [Planococcus citri]|uniref:uncharacterized protein LOC135835309 isoform X1 n=2 Tax=Planococcus citri TaxID=170843 RepID=UPI0031F8F4C6
MNLLLGDSQLKFVSFIPSYISKCWKSGMKLNTIPEEFWASLPNYDTVVIHLGTNHIPCKFDSPDSVQRKYMGLIRRIRKINTNSCIVISGIIPRSQNHYKETDWDNLNKKAANTNCLLKDIADSERNVFFLNNWASFTLPNGDPNGQLLSIDGLHLSHPGVQVLEENIKEVLLHSGTLINKHDEVVNNTSMHFFKKIYENDVNRSSSKSENEIRGERGTADVKSEQRITDEKHFGTGCSGDGKGTEDVGGMRGDDVSENGNRGVEGVCLSSERRVSTRGSSNGKKSERKKGDKEVVSESGNRGVEGVCVGSERHTSTRSSSNGKKSERKKGGKEVVSESGKRGVEGVCVGSENMSTRGHSNGKKSERKMGGGEVRGTQGSGRGQESSREKRAHESGKSSQGEDIIREKCGKKRRRRDCDNSGTERKGSGEKYIGERRKGAQGSCGKIRFIKGKRKQGGGGSSQISHEKSEIRPCNSKCYVYSAGGINGGVGGACNETGVSGVCEKKTTLAASDSKEHNNTSIKSPPKKMYPKKCKNCDKLITTKGNAYKHKKKCPLEPNNLLGPKTTAKNDSNVSIGSNKIKTTQKIYPKNCENCDKLITTKENAYKHKKKCPLEPNNLLSPKTDAKDIINCVVDLSESPIYKKSESNPSIKKTMYPKLCDFCGKNMLNRKANYIHNKRYCPKIKRTLEAVYKDHCYHTKIMRRCPDCRVVYSSQRSFTKHFKICNKNQIKTNLPCLKHGCISKFKTYSSLLKHLNRDHLVENDIISLSFSNISEFNNWKDDEQVDTYMYAINRSAKFHKNKKYIYYACQFDAARFYTPFKCKTSRRKKVGYVPHAFCPSRMFVHVTKDNVQVRYVKTHHNHKVSFENVKWNRFPRKFKRKIKLYLARGMDPKKILKYCQENQGEKESYEGKKKHTIFATSKQISSWSYELKKSQSLHTDDATAVAYWVHKNKEKVLVYKPQGLQTNIGNRDLDETADANTLFALGIQRDRQYLQLKEGSGDRVLCIDATHCTNQYKFYLVNLVISDCFGRGYPVGHFITNSMTYEVLRSLFSNIMTQHPDLSVSYIMTDDDPALYKAAMDVFGKGNKKLRHLLCKWHIERAWTKQLGVKIKNQIVRELVYKDLKKLLLLRRRDQFKKFQKSFIEKYSQSRHTKAFAEYYEKYYSNEERVKKWAFCYRTFWHFKTDTNMLVEAYHNELKTHWFKRCPNRRLDDLLDTLLAIEANKYLQNFYKKEVGMPTIYDKLGDDNTHNLGVEISDSDVITMINEFSWKIRSQRDCSVFYEVEKLRNQCSIPDHCSIKCTRVPCNDLCAHLYQCSCPHICGLCKHIHKIHIFSKDSSRNFHAGLSNFKIEHFRERRTCDENIRVENTANKTFTEMQRLTLHMDVLEKLDVLDQQQVYKNLRIANDIIDASKSSDVISPPKLTVPSKISPNSKLQTQNAQLHQTVKNRKIPRKKLQYSGSFPSTFTPAIHSENELTKTIFNVGPYNISLLYLKSIENDLPPAERNLCEEHDEDFRVGWLFDSIIDAYLSILCSPHPYVHVLDTAFYNYLRENEGNVSEKSWAFLDNRALQKLFMPFNLNGNHWALLVFYINVLKRDIAILLFDSNNADNVNDSSIKYIVGLWKEILKRKFPSFKIRDLIQPKHALQKDGKSCGVYVCYFVKQLLNNNSVSDEFSTVELREQIYRTIVESQLNDDEEA